MSLMDMPTEKRIVILEEDQVHKDRLKTAVEEMGHHAFIFDQEISFFNNFRPINADLIIFRSVSIDRVSRILNTIVFLNFHRPIIIFSDNADIDRFIATTLWVEAHILKMDLPITEVKLKISSLIQNESLHPPTETYPVIVGNSQEVRMIRKVISGLAVKNDAVLIQGEKGSGRELVAKGIHFSSTKKEDAFIKTNVSEQLFSSEQKKSAFTVEINRIVPSIKDVLGEENDGGTLYFEDIDAIPISHQGNLLQCFEDDLPGDVRVIASSRSKIDQLVSKGSFRKDLFFRLNVIKVNMPPLRERKRDIPLLADFFINKNCVESGICHMHISPRIKKALSEYHWPKNVDELEAFIASINIMEGEARILNQIYALTAENRPSKSDLGMKTFSETLNKQKEKVSLKEISRRFSSRIESEILKLVLDKTNWNRKQAAETLSISYKSLLNKIKAYNLN